MIDRPRAQSSEAKDEGFPTHSGIKKSTSQLRYAVTLESPLYLSCTSTLKHTARHLIPVFHADFDLHHAILSPFFPPWVFGHRAVHVVDPLTVDLIALSIKRGPLSHSLDFSSSTWGPGPFHSISCLANEKSPSNKWFRTFPFFPPWMLTWKWTNYAGLPPYPEV